MSPPDTSADAIPQVKARRAVRIVRLAGLGVLALLILVLASIWLGREQLAERLIGDYFDAAGVEATYRIEQIGPDRQVLRDLVIGDPARPDLTVERVEVEITPRFGLPDVTSVHLVRPRLFGTMIEGVLSFGALDPLVFTGDEGPFELPNIDLDIEDGRALLEGDYGPVGLRLTGQGSLRNGFAGELAAVAPRLAASGCSAMDATLYGKVSITDQRPRFAGPLRLAALACAGMATDKAVFALDLTASPQLDKLDGATDIDLAALRLDGAGLDQIDGDLRFTWNAASDPALTLRYDLVGEGLAASGVGLADLGIEGTLRARRDFAHVDLEGTFGGDGLETGPALDSLLREAATATEGTLARPLLDQVRRALAAQLPGSALAGDFDLRLRDGRTALAMSEGRLRNRSGASLLAVSRLQYASGPGRVPLLSGNFTTGGPGLPQIAGRIEQRAAGSARLALRMAPYRAGDSVAELPDIALVQSSDGSVAFVGSLRASGALPGGMIKGLQVPVSGSLGATGNLALWRDCTEVRFDALQLANLALDRRSLTICPPRGRSILQNGPAGLAIAGGAPSLALSGMLGETPIVLRSGAIGFAWPGAVSARQVQVTLGPAETATSFAIQNLSARIGADIGGTFDGTDVKLSAVPLDLLGASGDWTYAGGVFAIGNGSFRLEDRQDIDRFHALQARNAQLALRDNVITATAVLREPRSDRVVTDVAIRHDLASAAGSADLAVSNLLFDTALQPDMLTELAKGIVANVAGTVNGAGRIDWNAEAVTSRGSFSTESLDLAAAFGPVKGASGTIVFTDLLAMTTAPDQRIRVQSVNPGIEVNDGTISYQLVGGTLLRLAGGEWPFLGGNLVLEPLEMRFGNAETRRYVFQIKGLEAARFIERMELSNLAVTGMFDGTLPVVFDDQGNGRLEGGVLVARPPGGNVSYVGQLTYEDMGAIPNFAFQSLRSLDYRDMFIQMDGSLVGEIVTKVRLDGVSQGEGATTNILTRQIAKLPIRLDVNVRAPFYALISMLRRTYDPSYIPDPRGLGLLDNAGNAARPVAPNNSAQPIQPSESEVTP
jgi:hypothetical protein